MRAIAHGKGKEKIARTIYAKKMQQKVPGFAVFDAGISVHPEPKKDDPYFFIRIIGSLL